MIETLRTIIEDDLEWYWSYGRKDYANLEESVNESDTKPFFHMDPPRRNIEFGRTGNKTGWVTYSGRYMILLKSDSTLDEVYDAQQSVDPDDGKWRKRIRPIIESFGGNTSLIDQMMNALTCYNGLELIPQSQSIVEVINMFDENRDGVLVEYKWKVGE